MINPMRIIQTKTLWALGLYLVLVHHSFAAEPTINPFLEKHCIACHEGANKKGGLDLTLLKIDPTNSDNFSSWVKIHDRIQSGEMPPKNKPRPSETDKAAYTKSLKESLLKTEQAKLAGAGRTGIRRLTRTEYENTIRDLFDMPGIALQG